MKMLNGRVVSNKADKTIVVLVETRMTHPIYKKQYTRSARIAAHDEANEAQVGDKVTISETRPISATKRFKLHKIVAKAAIEHVEEELEVVAPKPKKAKTSETDSESRGEQPDEAIHSLPGALSGDVPRSKTSASEAQK